MTNSESERGRRGGSGEEEGYIEGLAMHWEGLEKVSQSWEDDPIDNLNLRLKK